MVSGMVQRNPVANPWVGVVRLGLILAGLIVAWPFLRWAIFDATFLGTTNEACSSAVGGGGGACWPTVWANFGLLMFSHYPRELAWRPILALVVLAAASAYVMTPKVWTKLKALVGVVLFLVPVILLAGVSGTPLTPVSFSYWGGFVLSMVLGIYGIVFAFPIGILLALGRRSSLPVIKSFSTLWIELIRGVPLVALLFMANFVLPLILPANMPSPSPIVRALVAIIIFAAAYIAEVIRGGLQAIPTGQYEAASSLGLNFWQSTRLVVMPQALRISIPPLISTFIGLVKDTSLVSIIGLFDLLGAAREVPSNPAWIGRGLEILAAAAAIYWVVCAILARYGKWLEKRTALLT